MSEVFRKFESSKNPRKINGLSYFTQEVESKFATWQETQVGKGEETEEIEDYSDDYGFEIESLSEAARKVVLDSLRAYKAKGMDNFIESVESLYTAEDWAWLMENLEQMK